LPPAQGGAGRAHRGKLQMVQSWGLAVELPALACSGGLFRRRKRVCVTGLTKNPAGCAVSRVLFLRRAGRARWGRRPFLWTRPCGRALPRGESGLPAAVGLNHAIAAAWPCTRWGLPCRRLHSRRGALLPHLFTLAARASLTGARRTAVCFLWHCPAPTGPCGPAWEGGRYPPPWFSGARTFLPQPI